MLSFVDVLFYETNPSTRLARQQRMRAHSIASPAIRIRLFPTPQKHPAIQTCVNEDECNFEIGVAT